MGSIVVKNLGKAYKQYPSRWGRLIEWLLPDQKKPLHTRKWVLKDVSFEIMPGESVGIVGVNGAGKSTLLKMITGTTQPTTGSVEVQGRVAALLELGMGFHPDFTGRQNMVMAAQLQGLPMHEIQALMPEIEAFAAIGDYIDQPVRVYSSGMQMRLAFAVATAKRPDVLIVDEALSVGDAAFGRKCFDRIESFRSKGTTLLFVSHDTATVKKICSKAIYLKDGRAFEVGEAKAVCDLYEQNLFGGLRSEDKNTQIRAYVDPEFSCLESEKSIGGVSALIESVCVEDDFLERVNVVPEGVDFRVRLKVKFFEISDSVHFGFMVRTVEGVEVYGTNTDADGVGRLFHENEKAEVSFYLKNYLASGAYFLSCAVSALEGGRRVILHKRIDCLAFKVVDVDPRIRSGIANLFARHSITIS